MISISLLSSPWWLSASELIVIGLPESLQEQPPQEMPPLDLLCLSKVVTLNVSHWIRLITTMQNIDRFLTAAHVEESCANFIGSQHWGNNMKWGVLFTGEEPSFFVLSSEHFMKRSLRGKEKKKKKKRQFTPYSCLKKQHSGRGNSGYSVYTHTHTHYRVYVLHRAIRWWNNRSSGIYEC